MEIQTCPHCRTTVLPSADGTCPSCRQTFTPIERPKIEPLPLAPPLSAFADYVPEARETFMPDANPFNPYAPPKSVDFAPSPAYDRPARKGLAWILFSFGGRIPRRVFWAATIGTEVGFILIGLSIASAFPEPNSGTTGHRTSVIGDLLQLLLCVPIIWTRLAIIVKRWHDHDKSGWWVLIGLIPIIGPIWAFVELGCLRGTYGKNQYGPDPT